MKKVLILAYDFPPLISVGGLRPNSWYKYFPACGYTVVVVTRKWQPGISKPEDYVKPTEPGSVIESDRAGNKIIRTPFKPNLRDRLLLNFGYEKLKVIRKTLSFFFSITEHLMFAFDAKAGIYKAALEVAQVERPQVIIATGEPFILFRYAHKISQLTGIPWIADYRDGWTSGQGNYEQGFIARWQQRFFRSREKLYLRNAVCITTAAPDYAERLRAIHPDKKIEVVYNGYDEEVFETVKDVEPNNKQFTISYSGIIYPHQQVEMFIEGFAKFVSELALNDQEVRVNFYGLNANEEVLGRIQNHELKEMIFVTGKLPYVEVAEKLKQSHVLLLLSKKNAAWLNAKLFDYLAADRPVLLVENDNGIARDILNNTGSGTACDTADEVCAFLKQQHRKFKEGETTARAVELRKNIAIYTRKNQATRFCALLDRVADKN